MTTPPPRAPLDVRIENLQLSFSAAGPPVLQNIDLAIAGGEFFSFLGPSGSGKSTLLRAIAGFGPRPRGRIFIGGQEITPLPPWRRDVGLVFQSYALWPHMSVRKNVAFGLEERRLGAAEITRRVEEALTMVGLLDLAERRPAQLSGGQQQRVALARTIVVRPKVLLLDEPLSNLDANLRVQMRREIRTLQKQLGITTIFVTHDQDEANAISDRIAVLRSGELEQVGAPIDVYDSPQNLFVANFMGKVNILPGVVEETAQGNPVMRLACGGECSVQTAQRGPCTLVFRPQYARIADQAAPGSLCLQGRVSHAEFLGATHRYTMQLSQDARLEESIQVDLPHHLGRAGLSVGESLRVCVPQEQLRVL